MKVIVGIGNPGQEYDQSRHNVGFAAVDCLHEALRDDFGKWKGQAHLKSLIAESLRGDRMLVKPQTFVNLTGQAIAALTAKHGVSPKDLLIVCDDVNLEFGKLRLRSLGSAGGHHGLESIIEVLKSEDFPRLRIGVGQSAMPRDLAPFVLGRFDPDERKRVPGLLDQAVLVCRAWADDGYKAAVSKLSQVKCV